MIGPSRCRVRTPFADSPEFLRLVRGEFQIDLARIALEIAVDAYPAIDIESYLDRIQALSARVRQRCSADAKPRAILGQINWVLFVEENFQGNEAEYYDPGNSYLNEVLDRKKGIPISLSVLYAAVAAPLGLILSGVALPAHFMLQVVDAHPTLFVDAFHSGALLDRAGCARQISLAVGETIDLTDDQIVPCHPSVTIARMLRNLKSIYLQQDDFVEALAVARRLAAVEPSNLDETRDWGLLAYQTGRPGEAIRPLSRYYELRPNAEDAARVAELLLAARREVAQSN